MFKFVTIFSALLVCAAATPRILSPAPLAYTNAPLYAAGGSHQLDVRHNYDGTLSSYTTTPFHYSGPYSSRYVAGAPAHYAGPAIAAAPAGPYAAPAKYFSPSGLASPYALSHAGHYTSPFAAPYSSSPYAAYTSGHH